MKNTTKKILSLILAVIMLLSVMPFGFSAEAKLSVDGQECVDAYIRMTSYGRNFYKHGNHFGGIPEFVGTTIENAISEAETCFPDILASYEAMNDSANAQGVSECTKIFKAATEDIEAYLEKHNFIVVIDTYEYYSCNVFELVYSVEELDKVEKAFNSEEAIAAFDIYREAGDLVYNGDFETQAEFDAFWKKFLPLFDKLYNCLDGKHYYTKADGNKTLVCEFCGVKKSVKDVFIEEYSRWGAYFEFCSYAEGSEAAQRYTKVNLDEITFQDILRAGKENDTEKMLTYTELFKEKNAEIEKAIDDGKLTVVIDGYYVALLMCKCLFYGNDLETDINGKPLYIREINADLFEEAESAFQQANSIRLNGGTQKEYDAAIKKYVDAYSLGLEHVFSKHDFNEYKSNNDATEEADGTKTATCEFCGATDTVIDEGSKIINNNKNDNCSCNCHKKGFIAFIWKILTFFYKIFGMNKTCACGIAHY